MKCSYCRREIQENGPGLDVSKMDDIEIAIRGGCDFCHVYYRFSIIGEMISATWLEIKIDGEEYTVFLRPLQPSFVIARRARVDKEEGGAFHYWEDIVVWDFIPSSWNPGNVANKIKNCLLFL